MIKSAKAFLALLGRWMIVWILDVMFGLASGILTLLGQADVHPIYWIGALLLGFVLAPLYAFHKLRRERDHVLTLLDNRARFEELLRQLSSMRSFGVHLRNAGELPLSDIQGSNWLAEESDWESSIIANVARISPFEAEWLTTLDRISVWRYTHIKEPLQIQKLWNLNETLSRLSRLIEQYRHIVWGPSPPTYPHGSPEAMG